MPSPYNIQWSIITLKPNLFQSERIYVMEYRKLGRSGVLVSPLCLGTMNFGGPTNEADAFAIMQKAVDAGINFFDTANVYTKGESERITGKFLKEIDAGVHSLLHDRKCIGFVR